MNLGIITSFIVGALLLLSLVAWSARVSQNSSLVTMNQMTKQYLESISTTINSDLRNLGQGVGATPIVSADSNRIVFRYATASGTQTVTWFWNLSEPLTGTTNPNDFLLTRTVNETNTEIRFGVSRFNLTYFDSTGSETLTPANIRRIRAEILVQSTEPYGIEYARSFWEADISPRALQN